MSDPFTELDLDVIDRSSPSSLPMYRVLVVDDEPNNLRIISEALSTDYDVIVANDGPSALRILESGEQPQLIILDVMMPAMNGFDLCCRIKQMPGFRRTPVIFITALNDVESEEKGFQVGAVDYIHKPFRASLVRARVRTHLSFQGMLDRLLELNEELQTRLKELDQVNQTLEKQSRELLVTRSSKNLFERVFMSTSEGILLTDADARVIAVNRSFSRITGYSESEALGRNPRFLKSGMHDQAFYKTMWRCIHEEGHWTGEIYNRRKDGECYPELRTISAVHDDTGEITNYLAVFSDITSLKQTQEQVDFLTWHDPVTRLPNRMLLLDRLDNLLRYCHRSGDITALMVVDLNKFKAINESHGYLVGDQIVRELAARLKTCVAEDDTLARLGADEFGLALAPHTRSLDDASRCADEVVRRIQQAMMTPFTIEGAGTILLECSVGIVMIPSPEVDSAALALQHADTAHHLAKTEGEPVLFFEDSMGRSVRQRFRLESDLSRAIEGEELRLFAQPQIDPNGHCQGLEVLVRWDHPQEGLLPPGRFIPIAEQSSLIVGLERWVLRQSVALIAKLEQQGLAIRVSVNICPRHFREADFEAFVGDLIDAHGTPSGRLTLEVTEGLMIENTDLVIKKMKRVVERGAGFSVDDFGTGYSSLAYLRKLPIEEVKIDRAFVMHAPDDPMDAEIVATINNLGEFLGLRVVAEGVETERHAALLTGRFPGMHLQGYHFGYPEPAEALLKRLVSGEQKSH